MAVGIEFNDGIATVTNDRPPAKALDDCILELLRETLADIDRAHLRGLLVTHAGGDFFSAGGNIKGLEGLAHTQDTGREDRFNGVLGELAKTTARFAIAANAIAARGGRRKRPSAGRCTALDARPLQQCYSAPRRGSRAAAGAHNARRGMGEVGRVSVPAPLDMTTTRILSKEKCCERSDN